jgi:hypothetical protein
VVAAARWAPGRFADGPNVISMWRALAGTATAYLWVPFMVVTSFVLFGGLPAMAYLAVSWAGLRSLYRWNKLSIALRNALKVSRAQSQQLLALHEKVVTEARARISGGRGA